MLKPARLQLMIWVFFFALFVMGVTFLGVLYFQHVRELQKRDPKYAIRNISTKGPLEINYFAELLELSIDQPQNLYAFDLQKAQKTLVTQSCIESVTLRRHPPSTLVIDYTMRTPIAFVGHQSNYALDSSGNRFPFSPFYPERELPILYFSEDPALAIKVLRESPLPITAIDVHQAEALSFGQRQIIVKLQNGDLLRLTPDQTQDALNRYSHLPPHDSPQVVDLRIPQLAFLSP